MCTFVDTFEKRGVEIGMARGRLSLLKKQVTNGIITLEDAAEEMEVSVSKIEDMFDEMDSEVVEA